MTIQRFGFVLILLFGALSSAAAADESRLSELAQFLDRDTPAQTRQQIFAAWHERALAGDTDAQYVVGSIYRRGDNAQPPTVERDNDKARRYLSTAAAHGRILAMAKMSEVELADDHPLEAMIWAQIYGYYRGWVGDPDASRDYGPHNERKPTLYFEDLLKRVSERLSQKFGDKKTQEVLAGLNQFVAEHDKDVRAQLRFDGLSAAWSGGRVKYVNAKSFHRVGAIAPDDVSEWLLAISADGKVASALPFDALPNFLQANRSHGWVMQYEADAIAAGSSTRYALKTLQLRKADWPVR